MDVIALIPARGGSKGVPGKNVRNIAGKPLIVHTIEQALSSHNVTEVVVSTDSNEIAAISARAGASVVRRPQVISGDDATSEAALIHALQHLMRRGRPMPELAVFLQCTSPVRRAWDIDGAVAALLKENADSLLSVSPNHRFLWVQEGGEAHAINYDYQHRPRRQVMNPQFVENGSIYVFRPQGLLETGNRLFGKVALYQMDDEAAIDIDSLLDLRVAEMILAERIGGA